MPDPTPSQASHPLAGDPVFDLHVGGKMEVRSTVGLGSRDDLSLAYTPGVARVCEAIAEDPTLTRHYTWVPNVVAVVTASVCSTLLNIDALAIARRLGGRGGGSR